MARSNQLTLKQRVERRIIEKLTVKPSTTGELAELTGDNYHTIRRVIKNLEDQGFAYPAGYRNGAFIYKLTEPDKTHKNNSIPVGPGTKGPIKLTVLLDLVGKEAQSATAIAAVSLPRNVVRLFMSALRYVDSGEQYNIDRNLKNIRLELETHRAQLVNMVALYDAVLQADVFWNTHKIKAIPYDETFDREQVVEAYRHYYPED